MTMTSSARIAASILVLTAFAECAPPAAADTVGRRYALIVGVSTAMRRGVPRLNFVDHDVEQLERMLKRQGYLVSTVPNDRADRRRIVEELYTHAVTLTEKDTFLLYYAGHGVRNVEVNQKTYWLTYDAELAMLDVQGIRLEHLLAYVDDIRAGRKLILLDHCFSGDVEGLRLMPDGPAPPLAGGGTAAAGPLPAAADHVPAPRLSRHATVAGDLSSELAGTRSEGTVVIAAARDEAYELQTLRHGVFTAALLQACSSSQGDDRDYRRSILELIRFVKPKVEELLKAARAPAQTVVDKIAGAAAGLDWYFCTLPVPEAEVEAKAAQYAAAIQAWETKGLLGAESTGALRRMACTDVLDRWKAAGGNPSELEDREHRVLTAIRLFVEPSDTSPEQARADALRDALEREGY